MLSLLILAVLSLGVWAVKHWYERREAAGEQQTGGAQQQPTPAPTAAPTPAPAPGEFRNVNITAKSNVYVSWVVDGKKSAGRFIGPDKPAVTLDPEERFALRYDRKDASLIEITIDGRRVRAVPDDRTQFEITKDNYAEFVR